MDRRRSPDGESLGLPRYFEMRADGHWRAIDFISDLHLCDETPQTFAAFSRYLLNTSADAVLILGDLFEVWVGDDSAGEGFEAECLEVIAQAACRTAIGFMHGNRDFLLGSAALRPAGVFALTDPTVCEAFGRRVLLTHGDALCLADTEYQEFRRLVHSEAWQAEFLKRPLAQRRAIAQDLRARSRERQAQRRREGLHAEWYDVDAASAVRWMHEAGARTMIHGHTHQPGTEPLAPGFVRHVLSDWHFEDDADGPRRGEVLRWTAQGFQRLACDAPQLSAAPRS